MIQNEDLFVTRDRSKTLSTDLGGRCSVWTAVGMRLSVKVVLAAVVLLRAKAPCGGEKGRKLGSGFKKRRQKRNQIQVSHWLWRLASEHFTSSGEIRTKLQISLAIPYCAFYLKRPVEGGRGSENASLQKYFGWGLPRHQMRLCEQSPSKHYILLLVTVYPTILM